MGKTNTDRDRAVALLRRYEPTPRHELDHEGVKKLLKPTEFEQLRGFLCWRCDKVTRRSMPHLGRLREARSKFVMVATRSSLTGRRRRNGKQTLSRLHWRLHRRSPKPSAQEQRQAKRARPRHHVCSLAHQQDVHCWFAACCSSDPWTC